MAWSRSLPPLKSVWQGKGDYDPGHLVTITKYLPESHSNPAGVEVRHLGSQRLTMMALRDLRDNYEQVVTRVQSSAPSV